MAFLRSQVMAQYFHTSPRIYKCIICTRNYTPRTAQGPTGVKSPPNSLWASNTFNPGISLYE